MTPAAKLKESLARWQGRWREKPRAASAAAALGVGAMLLLCLSELLGAPGGGADGADGAAAQTEVYTVSAYQAELEARLADLIGQLAGAGEATVMITLENGEEKIYALDTQAGQTQSQQTHVLLDDGSALEETVYLPTVCGVAVVCDGGGDVRVAARITALVSALLDVPSNRICVEQRRS